MPVVRYDDLPDLPWRNGRGTTREVHRDGRWRLSIATIAAAGGFSAFPGLDRTLVVARGTLTLSVGGQELRLGPGGLARFAGEQTVEAEPEGVVIAVNVMVARPLRADVRVGEWAGGKAEAVVDLADLVTEIQVRQTVPVRRPAGAVVVRAVGRARA
ncbi:HutD family protein [Kineosporia sp. J2-2]|uniref:HutD family protein n=1 Tax=Kineosporia corallincola TaxID=2835133 RepID=A0ABS5TK42_9ACTN|nr:HutD family protein [Kineosporia corallincola]MBT0771465.1 HutD family protein [Kineosporia corallincola]